ncbi:hypothetical protein AB4Y90_01535 [Chryseobacterium sp. 2TAF14]
MKKIFFVLILLIGFKSFAQESKVETDKLTVTEQAEFPGGDGAFSQELHKMIHAYIDLNQYGVNGVFTFIFDIDKNGKAGNLKVLPKVKNSEMFIDDMKFALKKVNKKWKPAMKNGVPIISQKIIKINFVTDFTDG